MKNVKDFYINFQDVYSQQLLGSLSFCTIGDIFAHWAEELRDESHHQDATYEPIYYRCHSLEVLKVQGV